MKFKNGEELTVTPKSHFHDPFDLTTLERAIQSIETKGLENVKKEVTFLFDVGVTNITETTEDDIIVWIKRKTRKKYSRFVRNKIPKQTKIFSVVAKKNELGQYNLITCYKGGISPPELKPTGNSEKSINFWKRHAFVYGTEETEGEELNSNPYKFSTNVR